MRQVDDKKVFKKPFKIRGHPKPDPEKSKGAEQNLRALSTKSLLRSSLKEMAGELETQGVIGCMKKSLTSLNVDKAKKPKAVPSFRLKIEKLGEAGDLSITTRAPPRSTSALSGPGAGGSKDLSQYFDGKKSFLQGFVNDRDKLRQILSQRNETQDTRKPAAESIQKKASTTKLIKNLKNII